MTKVTVAIPDAIAAKLTAKLAPHGYTIEQFAASSLSSFAESGAPISAELEKDLLDALESRLLDAGQVDWTAKAAGVRDASGRKTP